MYILGLVGSPRKGGNTELMVKEALEGAAESGAQTEMILLADKNIAGCDGCGACGQNGICKIKDDMQEIYQKLDACDGVIIGTPVYFVNVTAQAKAVMDRTYAYLGARKLRGKVAAALVTARRVGAGQVLSLMYTYFTAHRMIIAGGGIGYGQQKGDVKKGPGGSQVLSALEEARAVGRNVAWMVNRFQKGPGA